jgi:hypothetical protein
VNIILVFLSIRQILKLKYFMEKTRLPPLRSEVLNIKLQLITAKPRSVSISGKTIRIETWFASYNVTSTKLHILFIVE